MSLPFAEVTFTQDRKHGQKQPVEVLIRQREYHHDVAVITMDFESKVSAKYAHGAPVTIRWGWLPDDVEYFHGYVHHTEAHDLKNKRKQIKVFCIGASYRMKEVRLRSFKKKKAHQVAAIIAKDHGLSLLAECHHFMHDHLTQHGRSDWDFLVWLAKRVGYTFYCTKTDIVFTRRVIDYTPGRNRPTFLFSPARYRQRGAVYKLTHKVGENVPGTSKRKLLLQGVDDAGRLLKASKVHPLCDTSGTQAPTPAVFHKKVIKPVHHAAHAKSLLDGEADLHRFHVIGHGELSGNTQVRQGSTIRVVGLDSESDGFWYVGMVDHHITLTDYRMKVELGRDALGDPAAAVNGATTVLVSNAGKPVLLTDCDVSVDGLLEPAPESVYTAVDDCTPVEVLDQDEITGPVKRLIDGPFVSPARQQQAARKPTPTRRRNACTVPSKHPIGKKPAPAKKTPKKQKLNGWKAKTHVVRMKGPC